MKKYLLICTAFIVLGSLGGFAQDVFDPNDPVITYDSVNKPPVPADGVIGKWFRTPHPQVSLRWNTDRFKAYIYNKMAFRLRYPNNFNKSDQSTKYPLVLFLHGGGEIAPNTDNDFHLLLGAELFEDMIDQGQFNGYLLFPHQSRIGWEINNFEVINNVIDSLIKYGNADPDRLIVMGLSIGGYGSVNYASLYPTRTASAIPSSPSFITLLNSSVARYVHIPIWLASGGKDVNPDTSTIKTFTDAFTGQGGNLRHSYFPELLHDTWNAQWHQPFLAPTFNSAHKANPLVFFNRRDFCPDSSINVKIGISAGFYAYEWQKDNVTIATSTAGSHSIINGTDIISFTGNDITVRAFGTYRVRFKRAATADWSVWSPIPAVISEKTITLTPNIKVSGLHSKVLPAVDGATTVPLELPEGYIAYEWTRVSDSAIVSTDRIYVAPVGQYVAKVKEAFGCNSAYSAMFTVPAANGSPKPDAAKNLTAYNVSQTAIQIEWNENTTPIFNETAFEIYRGTEAGGPYKLIAVTSVDVKSYLDEKLSTQTSYYYRVRAVNETGASALTNEATAKTGNDVVAPTAPSNLKTVFTFRSFIELEWNSSSDNVGVYKYDIYINGVKRYTTSDTSFRVNNLEPRTTYNFTVKARDLAGNVSPASKQITASSILGGLKYSYFEGVWANLPDFKKLPPFAKGRTQNIDIVTPRSPGVDDFFGFLWEGYIYLPVAGTYTFHTDSDDGSKVYVNQPYDHNATPVVNNDGVHPLLLKEGTFTADTAGYYPIAITYFEANGPDETMRLFWTGPSGSGIPMQLIPNSAFSETYTIPGTIPAAPSALTATGVSYHRINVSWTDNSNNETGFEVTRSLTLGGTYESLGTVTGNSFIDTGLNANTTYYYRVRAVGEAGESLNTQGQGTTLGAPAAPAAPGTLAAQVISTNRINISWNDLSTGETGFEVFRSTNTAGNYRVVATLPPNTTGYADEDLFPNTTYFYKVRAVVEGNGSAFSNEVSEKTSNSQPQIKEVDDFTMKYGTSLTIPITVTDADMDDLKITTSRLPRFATLETVTNGNAVLNLNPQEVNRGNYPMKVYVDDLNGGYDTIAFIMVVNSNSVPILNDISNVSLSESGNLTVNMSASDAETVSSLNWMFEGLPAFASFSKDNAGHASLSLTPGYAASGVYAVKVKVDDGYGAWARKEFTITVNEKPAGNLWLVNMKDLIASPKSPEYWNDLEKISNFIVTNNLKTSEGVTTNAGVNIAAGWNVIIYDYGMPVDTGVYPMSVMREAGYFGVDTIDLYATNLNPAGLYNFRFFSSSKQEHPGYTGFKSGNKKDSVAMMFNTKTRATLNALAPDATGTINIKVYRTSGANIGFLNAFEFQEVYNDGTIPVTPANLAAEPLPGSGNRLKWRDIAYNETSYQVFRSENEAGPFTLLNAGATNADDSSYIDATAVPETRYYYYVTALNTVGHSPETDTVTVFTGNNPPVISQVADMYVKTGNTVSTDFNVTDDAGETVTVTAENLPPFASLQHLGGTSYRIVSTPGHEQSGWYYVQVRATDNLGGSSGRQFRMTISDNSVNRTVLININSASGVASGPWNNITGHGHNRTIVNLKTDDNQVTGISLSTLDPIDMNNTGFITGNNSGIVPDSVLSGGWVAYGTGPRRLKLGGLDPTKFYSIGIISSWNSGEKNISTFTATGNGATQTIAINARHNNTSEGRFNGLVPTAGGDINLTMSSEEGAPGTNPWIILNGLVIQEYSGGLLRPLNVVATPSNTVTKRKITVTWSDRSSTETSFEVQRSLTPDFSSVASVSIPANTTTHIDSVLNADAKYYYRVRALTPAGNTEFSNTSSAISAADIVYINLTNHSLAPAPWNNTGKEPLNGDEFTDLKNESGRSSGVTLTIDSTFQGAEEFGYSPANNPGVLPPAVNNSNYTINQNQLVKLRLGGLDVTKSYRIGFSGSISADGLFNSSYTIGNRTVYLNAAFNSTKVIYISDVVPNINGEVVIRVSTTSIKGFMNALIIERYTGANGAAIPSTLNRIEGRQQFDITEMPGTVYDAGVAAIYPNPFNQHLNIDIVNTASNSNVNVEIYDLMGRVVYNQVFRNIMAGKNTLRLQSVSSNMSPGVYMLRVKIDGKLSRSFKLVKASQ